jgi:hypothetical protein
MNRNRTHISRRHFLQFAIAALATPGLHPLVFQRQAQRYGQVLAQNTPRKLALLVGINSSANVERAVTVGTPLRLMA